LDFDYVLVDIKLKKDDSIFNVAANCKGNDLINFDIVFNEDVDSNNSLEFQKEMVLAVLQADEFLQREVVKVIKKEMNLSIHTIGVLK